MSNEKPKSEQRGMDVHLACFLTERPIPTHTSSHAWRHSNFLSVSSITPYLVICIKVIQTDSMISLLQQSSLEPIPFNYGSIV